MVSGYPSRTFFLPGETVDFHLSSITPGDTAFFRQWDDRSLVHLIDNVDIAYLREPDRAWLGFHWPVNFSFTFPDDWRSGLYYVLGQSSSSLVQDVILYFVVRAANPGEIGRILYAVDLVTPQAYNRAGGKNFYDNGGARGARAVKVSLHRPLLDIRDSGRLIPWLHENYFTHDCASLIDLHSVPDLLEPYQCLIYGRHAEYWSREMRDQVEDFVARSMSIGRIKAPFSNRSTGNSL